MALYQAHKNKRKKMKRRFIFRTITLVIILAAVIFALIMNLTRDKGAVKKGNQVPDFELTQLNENYEQEHIRLSDLEGKGVVLNFWATYCKPCEAQLPLMETLYPEYKDDIEIVTISLDNSDLVIKQFIDKYNLTFAVLHDKRSEVMGLYSVSPIPNTFFISPEGEVQDEVVGAIPLEKLESHFKAIQPN
ncbi:thiol-disulfide oxidoreductase ResA [Virgibacillus sp. MSJ-26]|uniref:thiol-disulfide oxidoreductase ResA n=1 Tax=Virgibacillus sp. MSJ-26 TaxID=2841522 RepID=UPI001C125659|nr:thiol-disulfide oxidoreductase ResA [Virgibacillus sp. MSJ-26]MBU5467097.1 thiol-disulfide oxidoreductase ResA [Virgibacillus sp. MSJ-26]